MFVPGDRCMHCPRHQVNYSISAGRFRLAAGHQRKALLHHSCTVAASRLVAGATPASKQHETFEDRRCSSSSGGSTTIPSPPAHYRQPLSRRRHNHVQLACRRHCEKLCCVARCVDARQRNGWERALLPTLLCHLADRSSCVVSPAPMLPSHV